ncbi:MAG: S1 RNA-binding domain-containing protein [Fibrobacter sp.]|nr:S1 RNA-binding domain-containing protein [Fibrobacter sp.]
MIEFSKQISEKWNLSAELAEQLCIAYEKRDTVYYLNEYRQDVAVELSLPVVWEIYDFLNNMEELSSKKKRVINALRKAEQLNPTIEKRVNLTTNSFELDDLLAPLRPNPRSKGQIAAKKGLEPLADLFVAQKEESVPVDELAKPYIGKDESLNSLDAVLQGVKDIIAERFAYDETVRMMARDFSFEDGYFDIVPKNKKDPQFASYVGKFVPIKDLSKDDILKLLTAEENKNIRLKIGVQLFRITELIRHHFITNPDSVGFDLLCEAIDECWTRLLLPIVERDVKTRLKEESEEWASKRLVADLEKILKEELARGPVLIVDGSADKTVALLAVNGQGDLLGVTTEKKPPASKNFISDRLKQFLTRHKPVNILIIENEQAGVAETMINQAIGVLEQAPEVSRLTVDSSKNPSESEWMQKEFSSLLEPGMRDLYGQALLYLKPVSLLQKLGTEYYTVHPLQPYVSKSKLLEIVNRHYLASALQQGVVIKDVVDSPLLKLTSVTPEILHAIKVADTQGNIAAKNDLLKVPGMSEVVFRNIAGFIIIPTAEYLPDRTLVHPDYFGWFTEIGEQLNVSLDTIVTDPEILRSYNTEDPLKKIYIEKKLIAQIEAGRKYISLPTPKVKRKLKLNELQEGAIVSGRVTNITPFGVFVNINAVCDGLIHISQLADEYVETPEQVVAINEKVDVKILKVDVKKRRISLTMKSLGNKSPKVRPSKGQLDHLAEHFKNR